MIVKCDQCQTRFKIPDDKVTEKGVKVRCTRCHHTFRVARAPDAAASSAPTPEADPFARFGAASPPSFADETRPRFFREGVEASRRTTGGAISVAQGFGHDEVPPDFFDQPTRVAPVPQQLLQDLPPAPEPSAPPSFDPSDPFAGLPDRPLTDFEATSPVAPTHVPDPFSDPFADPPPPPSLDERPATERAAELLSNLPPTDDPFGLPASNPEPDRALFDMGPATGLSRESLLDDVPAEPPPPEPPPRRPVPVAPPPPTADSAAQKPAGKPDDVGMADRPAKSAIRRTVGTVLNVAVAAVLLFAATAVYLNGGNLDAATFSLEPFKALFAAPGELVAVEVSNGLYDSVEGRSLFYVRGEVENRGERTVPIGVKVEIVDGTLTLTQQQTVAGASATPEELYAIRSAKDAERLDEALRQRAVEVKPGARAPFFVVFYEYPPQLDEYRLQLTVTER